MRSLEQARAAKAKIKQMLGDASSVVGIGITRQDDGYALKVNLREHSAPNAIPQAVDGVPVQIEVVGNIVKSASS
jgi:hypothetical protein